MKDLPAGGSVKIPGKVIQEKSHTVNLDSSPTYKNYI